MIKMQKSTMSVQKPKSYGQLNASYQERLKWYQSARWKITRRKFLEENPLCVKCLEEGIEQIANTVDHIDGHEYKTWKDNFWTGPFMALCSSHHSQKTTLEDMKNKPKRMTRAEKIEALNKL